MTEDEDHQHFCCVECGSDEKIAYVGGYTICFNCIKAFKKRHNLAFMVLDEFVGQKYKQTLGYSQREEEKKKDISVG